MRRINERKSFLRDFILFVQLLVSPYTTHLNLKMKLIILDELSVNLLA